MEKTRKYSFVELPPTEFGMLPIEAGIIGEYAQGKKAYDIYSKFNLPPRATNTLAAIAIEEGHEAVFIDEYHGNEGRITRENWNDMLTSDTVFLSAISRTIPQTYELAKELKKAKPELRTVLGGFHVTESTLYEILNNGIDVACIGEGENTLRELINFESYSDENLSRINGLAYNNNGILKKTPVRELMTDVELGNLPAPYFDEITRNNVSLATVRTSVGCKWKCDFCSVSNIYKGTHRIFPEETITRNYRNVEDMGRTVFTVDDNLGSNPAHLYRIADAVSNNGLTRKMTAQVDAGCTSPEKIEALKKMGVQYLCLGFESMNEETLKRMNKPFKPEKNTHAAEIFRKAGFWVHGMFIVGLDGDTPESTEELLQWSLRHTDSAQFFAPITLPETRLTERLRQEGRLLTRDISDYSYYDGWHVLSIPEKSSGFTSPSLQETIMDLHQRYYGVIGTAKRMLYTPNRVYVAALSTQVKPMLNAVPKTEHFKSWMEKLNRIS